MRWICNIGNFLSYRYIAFIYTTILIMIMEKNTYTHKHAQDKWEIERERERERKEKEVINRTKKFQNVFTAFYRVHKICQPNCSHSRNCNLWIWIKPKQYLSLNWKGLKIEPNLPYPLPCSSDQHHKPNFAKHNEG